MTVLKLYNILAIGLQTTICDIKAKCLLFPTCLDKSQIQVIDFDPIAKSYGDNIVKQDTPKSVDAITLNKVQNLLILIEKKTWYRFYQYTGTDKSYIDDKIREYQRELQEKYEATNTICSHFASMENVLKVVPHVYVFLTEIGEIDSTEGFATMLGDLALASTFSVSYETVNYTVNSMQMVAEKVSNCRYVYCKDFDKFVGNLY